MKITRSVLLKITVGLGGALIVYALLRHFTGIQVDEEVEKFILDGVIFAALGLFIYNRKLASDEKKAREAKEREEAETAGEAKG
ncbi:MAG: hypothetical protein LBR99_05930 [Treponema sp.]|jgi:uncharacterized membrane protein YeaQ/YmgE (transglycosylase-associated protein family)|nr:hypothetical protein [Treponema sp.]